MVKATSLRFKSVFVALALAALVTLVVAAAVQLGALEGAELEAYDYLISRSTQPPPPEVLYVDFDDAAMQAWGVSQIPRDKLAGLIQKASAGGAEIIGLDVLLDEPRRCSTEDTALAAAIANAGNVVLASVIGNGQLPGSEPLALFRQHALKTGFVDLPQDSDSFLRRAFLWMNMGHENAESFALALAVQYLGRQLQRADGGTYRLGTAEIYVSPKAPNTFLIGAWSREPVRTIPVMEFLEPRVEPGVAEGKIVLVGSSSSKGKDRFATPQFRFYETGGIPQMLSGTEVFAAAIASLLHGHTIETLGRAQHWTLNYLFAAFVALIVVRWRFAAGIAAALGGFVFAILVAEALFARGVWMPFVSTEMGVMLVLPVGLGYRFLEERRLKALSEAQRGQLMSLFERYVSPELASEIWERRDEIVLGGQERTATILFSDIRNFTRITAGRPSAEVLAWLNEYLTAMDHVIRSNGGFLNKFIGDGIMVIFGAPLPAEPSDGARKATECALAMLERVEELNRVHVNDARYPQLAIGIGVHTGTVTAGNVGSQDRLEYSVIGEAVNLASRLETLTKEFKAPIVMSPETHALVKEHFHTRLLGETLVRGFDEKIPLFTAARPVGAEVVS